MTSLRELARLINDMNGTKLDYKGAKRRLDMLGATVEDLKSPAKVQHILRMCSEPPCIWTMYDHLMVRAIKSEKELAELQMTVTNLKAESADHLQAIAKLNECIDTQDETIERMQVDADKAADRIQQLEEECERLRARIDQLEKGQDDYAHKNHPSYVEED